MDDTDADPWAIVRELGAAQGGVVSRRQLYAAGLTRWQVQAQLKAKRWQRTGDQSVCLHNGPVEQLGQWWAAVFQGGPRACLDGASALVAGGLERYRVDRIRVSVPRGGKARRTDAFDIRQTRRLSSVDMAPAGIPRTRPEVAAVRAALWAKTDRQATHLLTLTVQQGLAPAAALGQQALRIRRDKRRALVHSVVGDLLDGARSLGEIDVARELARRGLPVPDAAVAPPRQARPLLPRPPLAGVATGGRDRWHPPHLGGERRGRRSATELPGHRWRHDPPAATPRPPHRADDFFDQIEEALRTNGWLPAVA